MYAIFVSFKLYESYCKLFFLLYKWFLWKSIYPEEFCFNGAKKNWTLQTEDFAMMITFSRLYGITNNGKCYIKPSKRGLFNSTMKYIFGNNYEKDRIIILCKKLENFPVLVITSDKILNKTLSYFSKERKFTFFDKKFNIKNKVYFQNDNKKDLSSEGQQLLDSYGKCVKEKSIKNCEVEWDTFTQFNWPNIYSDNFIDIPGFERY